MRVLIDTLMGICADIDVACDYAHPPTPDRLHGESTKAIQELGLKTHAVTEILKDTGDSLIAISEIVSAKEGRVNR